MLTAAPAHSQPRGCPDKELKQARSLMAAGHTGKALELYHGIEDRCLDVAEDLLYLGPAAAKLKQYRKAMHYNTLMAEHSPPAKRARFLAEKEQALRRAPPCQVAIDTDPRGATVVVNGKEIGVTGDSAPLALVLKGGKHSISIRLAGHQIHQATFETEFGEEQVLSYTLKPHAPASPAGTAAPDDTQQPTPAPGETPEDEPAPEASTSGPFVGLLGGPVWADYGDSSLSVGAGMELGLDGGYVFRNVGGLQWLGLQVHGTVLYSPVNDSTAGETSHFISVLAGGGARLAFWRLWADIRLSVGAALLAGASEKSFLFSGSGVTSVSGVFANVAIRAAAGVGWTFYKGLFVAIYPAAIDYSPRFSDFVASIGHVFRYQLALAVGWEG